MRYNIDRKKKSIYFGTPSGGLPAAQKNLSGGGRNIFKFIAFFSDILIALPIWGIRNSHIVCFKVVCSKIMWKTNCSNKIIIFLKYSNIYATNVGKKCKNWHTFKKREENVTINCFHKNLSVQKCSNIIKDNVWKKLSDLRKS